MKAFLLIVLFTFSLEGLASCYNCAPDMPGGDNSTLDSIFLERGQVKQYLAGANQYAWNHGGGDNPRCDIAQKKAEKFAKVYGKKLHKHRKKLAKLCGDDDDDDSDDTEIEFPEDHLLHFDNNEWYYFSGVVDTDAGKQFGVMFTIFQFPDGEGRYHLPVLFAVSDPEISEYYSARTGPIIGASGGTAEDLPAIGSGNSAFTWDPEDNLRISSTLNTEQGGSMSMDIDFTPRKKFLFHGEDGFIPMGDGIPSAYYSLTNLKPTRGTITVGDQQYTITGGRVWMDHQWGDWTSSGDNWDWFSLRFDDGGSLMLFQFRDDEGNVVGGDWTYRDKHNKVHYGTDFEVVAKRSFGIYPIDWTVKLPSIDAEFEVKPLFDDQAFIGLPLWEGLCELSGSVGSAQLSGHAFVELNGY